MSESEEKAAVLPPQNGGSENSKLNEKPVKDPLGISEPDVKKASLGICESKSTFNESDDKLDEFSRLELEMAELDKTDNALSSENSTIDSILVKSHEKPSTSSNKLDDLKSMYSKDRIGDNDNKLISCQNGQTSENDDSSLVKGDMHRSVLDHEDLIAVLKGDAIENQVSPKNDEPKKLELPQDKPASVPANVTEGDNDVLIEGVTIEGEGEYQIMEVVDDIDDEIESVLPSTSKNVGAGPQAVKRFATSQKLTPEEERAMAMEQIAGLNARVPRRRKQDIKPLQIETSELVSNLGADWSDDDDDGAVDNERPTSKNAATIKQSKIVKKDHSTKLQLTAEEVTSTAGDTKGEVATGVGKKRRNSLDAKVTGVLVINPPTEGVGNEKIAADIVTTSTPEPTGFKRTRTIKRRIIWDPDAPETAFSYAKLVRSNVKDRSQTVSPAASKSRSVTPKEVLPTEKRGIKRAATPLQAAAPKSTINENVVKADNFEMPSTSKQARRSETKSPDVSSSGSAANYKKKKISEIDRLMGDEGAANMLNSLEGGRNKTGDDSDKPHKPLMRNRVNAAEKANKKDATSISTTPSKNKRAPKAKPSASWEYVYQNKQELSEDSMIIRRRSNSSYSSNASQHRLSLDGPPNDLLLKSNAKSSEEMSDDANENNTHSPPRKLKLKDGLKSTSNGSENGFSPPNLSKLTNASGGKVFEFAKPKDAKSNQKTPNRRSKSNATNTLANDIKKTMPKRGPGRPTAAERVANAEQSIAQSTAVNSPSNTALSNGEDVYVKKIGRIAHISFNMNASQMSCTFTSQLMNKLVSTLSNLAEDVNCHVVMVTTNSSNFCQGIDITKLATGSVDQRKSAAIVLAAATKNYLRTLATFPKPLVAGIHGTIIGLGVIQLPLFDVVIASDKTSFETPYAKIGQLPEGFCIWQSLSNIRETAKTKLLWLAEKMYSTEASTTGLIDKLTTAERVSEDAMNIARKISTMSVETYRYMKDSIIKSRLEAINLSLDDEFNIITSQWTSAECFNKFRKSVDVGHF